MNRREPRMFQPFSQKQESKNDGQTTSVLNAALLARTTMREITLETLLCGKGTILPDNVRALILYNIARELAALQKSAPITNPEYGLLAHRNLKAENVLLCEDWKKMTGVKQSQLNQAPIARLGIKGAAEQTAILDILNYDPKISLRVSKDIGDLYYMPPEGWTLKYNPAADMYRFGLLCFEIWLGVSWSHFEAEDREAITGPLRQPPSFPRERRYRQFNTYGFLEMIGASKEQIAEGRYAFAKQIGQRGPNTWLSDLYKDRFMDPSGCPKGLYKLIQRCWNTDPTKRPTVDEALVVLDLLYCDLIQNAQPNKCMIPAKKA